MATASAITAACATARQVPEKRFLSSSFATQKQLMGDLR